jgi:adenylylsulfate kinase-like enzyme
VPQAAERMVIVITGPIASGKSTVAGELARELGRAGVPVAVIDLDVVHDMLASDGHKTDHPTWELARRAAAILANTFLEQGVAVVVAEGSFNTPGDRSAFAQHLDAGVEPVYVTLRVSYEEALRRAQTDPTRGVSRDPAFLGRYFAGTGHGLGTAPETDLVIETERMSPTSAAAAIASLVSPDS